MELIDEEIAKHVSFHLSDNLNVVDNIEKLISILEARIAANPLPELNPHHPKRYIRQAELNHKDQVTKRILIQIMGGLDIAPCESLREVEKDLCFRVTFP